MSLIPRKYKSFVTDSLEQSRAEESDRLRHSIDATAAELAEAGHEFQAEVLKAGQVAGADDGPVVRLVNLIIDTAVNMRASDIHIEPMADRVRVRYRLDGVCFEKDNYSQEYAGAVDDAFENSIGYEYRRKTYSAGRPY